MQALPHVLYGPLTQDGCMTIATCTTHRAAGLLLYEPVVSGASLPQAANCTGRKGERQQDQTAVDELFLHIRHQNICAGCRTMDQI